MSREKGKKKRDRDNLAKEHQTDSACDEILKLDPWSTTLPANVQVKNPESQMSLANICCKYFPLLRYHAAGLIDELIPVNLRAEQLQESYLKFRDGTKLKESNMERGNVNACDRMEECQCFSKDMDWRRAALLKIECSPCPVEVSIP